MARPFYDSIVAVIKTNLTLAEIKTNIAVIEDGAEIYSFTDGKKYMKQGNHIIEVSLGGVV